MSSKLICPICMESLMITNLDNDVDEIEIVHCFNDSQDKIKELLNSNNIEFG